MKIVINIILYFDFVMLSNRFGKFNINRLNKFNKFNNFEKSTNMIDNFKTAQNTQLCNFSTIINFDREKINLAKNQNMSNHILNQKKYLSIDFGGFLLTTMWICIGYCIADVYYIVRKEKTSLEIARSEIEKLKNAKKELENKNVIKIVLDKTDMSTLAGAESRCYTKNINGINVIISVVPTTNQELSSNKNPEYKK